MRHPSEAALHWRAQTFLANRDAIIVTDMQGRILDWNPAAERIFGYARKQMLRQPVARLVLPENAPDMIQSLLEEMVRDGSWSGEMTFVRKDGGKVLCDTSISPLADERGQIVGAISVSRDITERKQTERAAAWLAAIITSAEDAIASKTLDSIVTSWNASAERMFGYTAEEMIGQSILKIIPPDRKSEEDMIIARLRAGEHIEHFETQRVTKDGRLLDVSLTISPIRNSAGKIIGASKIARDISERKRIEAALRESEENFRALANNIPTLAWMAKSDGYVFWYNQRWYEYTGMTPETQAGWGWQSVQDPDLLPQVMEEWTRSLATGEPFEMVFPLKGADGIYRPYLTRAVPITDEQGRVVRWFGTNTDVTEQHKAEEALRAANDALEAADHIKDEFLSIASHELRTPLTSIKVNIQLAARQLRSLHDTTTAAEDEVQSRLERTEQLLERSERQVSRMDRLVADLLDFSRIQSGNLELRTEPCDLRDLVSDAVREQRAAWPEREITLELPRRGSTHILADPDRISQVVTNVLTNALKYSAADCPIVVRLRVQSDAARVEIRDQGPGLTPEQQAHLFERFYRVPGIEQQSGSGVGLGLGLYICKTIVERHCGTIGVRSQPGEGSTFWFTLPLRPLEDALDDA